jgi:capsular exopolysaccharide synthesis family protein
VEFAKEDLDLVAAMRAKINGEIEALRIEMRAPSRVTALSDKPAVIKREGMAFKAAPIAGLVGFLLAALAVAFLEFRARRVNGITDISGGLHLPVVGTLPLVESKARRGLIKGGSSAEARQQILIESVDSARTMLLHEFRRRNLRAVMVASAGPGEGKTVLSAHLSASLARAGWRVLLVDGDLRRPSLHKVFGFEPTAGLGDALRDDVNIRDVIQPGPAPGLWVVPAGFADTLSLRALAQGRLTSLFEEIKNEFDFIILDSAPVLPVADAQLMAQSVDGVILSVLQNVSRLPLVYAAFERLALLQANVIGAVIHGSGVGAYDTKYSYLALPQSRTEAPQKAE